MSLDKLLAIAKGKEQLKKALNDVRYEIMMRTMIRLSGENLEQEIQKSVDEFLANQKEADETSRGVSEIIANQVKEDILDSVAEQSPEKFSYEVPMPR